MSNMFIRMKKCFTTFLWTKKQTRTILSIRCSSAIRNFKLEPPPHLNFGSIDNKLGWNFFLNIPNPCVRPNPGGPITAMLPSTKYDLDYSKKV